MSLPCRSRETVVGNLATKLANLSGYFAAVNTSAVAAPHVLNLLDRWCAVRQMKSRFAS